MHLPVSLESISLHDPLTIAPTPREKCTPKACAIPATTNLGGQPGHHNANTLISKFMLEGCALRVIGKNTIRR